MGKISIQYDPQFNVKNKNQIIQARQSLKSNTSRNNKRNLNRWRFFEQQKYMNFVKNNIQKFKNPKQSKIFVLMSKEIKTRNSQQCKTHHSKMILKCNKSLSILIRSWSKNDVISQHAVQIPIEDDQTSLFIQQINHEKEQAVDKTKNNQKSIEKENSSEQHNIFNVLTL